VLRKLTCKELVELVTDYFEGRLPRGERRRFERHLAGCDACSIYLEQMRQTIELTGAVRTVDVSAEAEAALLEAFREWQVASG
jgi:anti-sigma factor RsiW